MSGYHSNSECENILSSDMIGKDLINNRGHSEQLHRITKLKGKLIVYLSIIYGATIAAGLIYLFIT